MKRLLFLSVLFLSVFINAQKFPNLQVKINDLSDSDILKHGQWGVYAEYVDSGEKIISLNDDMSLAPASGLKVFTTSVALNLLGEDYTYKTKLFYDGEISSVGKLNGNIYIKGGGDPTLGSGRVKGSLSLDSLMVSWITAVKQKGINEINGAVIVDDSFFDNQTVPDYWPWIDIGNYYGAGPNSLTINDNLYYLYFKPSVTIGGKAEVIRTEPGIPGLSFINYMETGKEGSGDNGYIYAGPGQFTAVLRGTIPAGVKEFSIKGSIPDPPMFAAQYFIAALIKNGIPVQLPPAKLNEKMNYDQYKLLNETVSPPLKEIVFTINKISFNLYTEHLLKTIGLEKEGKGSTRAGINVVKSFLDSAGIPTGGFELYDGSGLSRTNTITAVMMAKLLSFMSKQKTFNTFFSSLVEFKLQDERSAWVKTGLINGVRSHSGYVRDSAGRLISFSFIANNFPGRVSQVSEAHRQLMDELSKLK